VGCELGTSEVKSQHVRHFFLLQRRIRAKGLHSSDAGCLSRCTLIFLSFVDKKKEKKVKEDGAPVSLSGVYVFANSDEYGELPHRLPVRANLDLPGLQGCDIHFQTASISSSMTEVLNGMAKAAIEPSLVQHMSGSGKTTK